MDLILSSGFLAFARHVGAIAAVLSRGVQPDALVGTSSGALVGALFQAGLAPPEVGKLLSDRPPLRYMRAHVKPWRGLFSLESLVPLLRRNLPRTFEELPRPFAVGVRDERGGHRLICQGELVSAVMASIAIPFLFPPVLLDGHPYMDGGVVDRTGVDAWRRWRPNRRAIVHVVERSRGRDVAFDTTNTTVVRTPRSGAKFWFLGDFAAQQLEAKRLVELQLTAVPPAPHDRTSGGLRLGPTCRRTIVSGAHCD
jgi:predicted acylesterase/phospholipase RssA